LHHDPSRGDGSGWLGLLKKADTSARQNEIRFMRKRLIESKNTF
jgi:hypothetical protein